MSLQPIQLNQIAKYSACAQKYSLSQISLPTKTNDGFKDHIKELIKQCYVNRTKSNSDPTWETVKNRINKICFEDADINNKEEFNEAYKLSIRLLTVMHHWYYKQFTKDKLTGFVNLPLSYFYGSFSIEETLDLVFLDNKFGIIPVFFSDIPIAPLYNNIEYKSLLYMLYLETNVAPEVTDYLIIKEESVIRKRVVNKVEAIKQMGKHINHILTGISNKVFTPAVSEQCDSCEFKSICSF